MFVAINSLLRLTCNVIVMIINDMLFSSVLMIFKNSTNRQTTTHLTDIESHIVTNARRLIAVLQEVHDLLLVAADAVGNDAAFGALLRLCGTLWRFAGHHTFDIWLNQILKFDSSFWKMLNSNGTQSRIVEARCWILHACELDLIADGDFAARVEHFGKVEKESNAVGIHNKHENQNSKRIICTTHLRSTHLMNPKPSFNCEMTPCSRFSPLNMKVSSSNEMHVARLS